MEIAMAIIPTEESEGDEGEGEDDKEGNTEKVLVRREREVPKQFASVDPAIMERLIESLKRQQEAEENGEGAVEEIKKEPLKV